MYLQSDGGQNLQASLVKSSRYLAAQHGDTVREFYTKTKCSFRRYPLDLSNSDR